LPNFKVANNVERAENKREKRVKKMRRGSSNLIVDGAGRRNESGLPDYFQELSSVFIQLLGNIIACAVCSPLWAENAISTRALNEIGIVSLSKGFRKNH
jgi:hypothetical protein